jgi:cytosine/adenosine deaminase-related metal-dependent hydrolase
VPLEETLYRGRGYLPPVDALPWRDEYFAPRPPAVDTEKAREAAEKAAREQARKDFLRRFR